MKSSKGKGFTDEGSPLSIGARTTKQAVSSFGSSPIKQEIVHPIKPVCAHFGSVLILS